MSHRFHSFRAPANLRGQPSKRNLLPLPSVTSRKAATRFIRDVTHGLRSLSKLQLIVASITFALVAFSCIRSSLRNPETPFWISNPLRATECACPAPRTPEYFCDQVLSNAGFVASVQIKKTLRGFLVLEILELYRGHSRAVQWPLLVKRHSAVGCNSDSVHDDREPSTSRWLVVAHGITSTPAEIKATLGSWTKETNFSFLLPGELKGPRCEVARSKDSSPSGIQSRMVWLTPWDTLSRSVAESILRDSGNEPIWWRSNDASLEFKDSIRRALTTSEMSKVEAKLAEDAVIQSNEWWLRDGVSIIAACKDRTQTLQQAVLTWLAADGVDEVVVVDWSSNPSIKDSLSEEVLLDPRIVLVRAEGQSQWILSRAYNLAARSSSFSKLMKVDCDTVLSSDFFSTHDLQREEFFAGDWRQLESGATNALHTNGLLFVYRDDFLAVGGFDARITTYGWDDSDLAERLAKFRSPRNIIHGKLRHISHPASLRVKNQPRNSLLPPSNPFAASVEIQRNRLLLTKYGLPIWRADSSHVVWNVRPGEGYVTSGVQNVERVKRLPFTMYVKEANDVTAASALVSDADAEEVAKRSIRLILRRLGLSLLPNTLTFNFYKTLIAKVADPGKYAEVVLTLGGGCVSKLLAHASSKEATAPGSLGPPDVSNSDLFVPPPYPYSGWRLQELWKSSDDECSCPFSAVFDATEEEVMSEWLDERNDPRTGVAGLGSFDSENGIVERNVTNILGSFATHAAVKNVSTDISKWFQKGLSSKILFAETSCTVDPMELRTSERKRMRESIAALTPSEVFLKRIRDSFATKSKNILDSPLLHVNTLSETQELLVQDLMNSSQSAKLVSAWTASPPLSDANIPHILQERTRALIVATVLEDTGIGEREETASSTKELQDVIARVSVLIKLLFRGCQAAPSKYIQAYPELVPIITGFVSCRVCF